MRTIKFRAWEEGERLSQEYVKWAVENKYFIGGKSEDVKVLEQNYRKETGKSNWEKYKEMRYDINISKYGNEMSLESGWDYQGDNNHSTIMQFTGLKDKNGKDVYEGDVLRNILGEKMVVKFGTYYPEHNHCCVTAGFYINKNIEGEDRQDFISPLDKYEVIGNIYENPELTN